MNETSVQGVASALHSPEFAGSWLSRLPKFVAACPPAGSGKRAHARRAQTTKTSLMRITPSVKKLPP